MDWRLLRVAGFFVDALGIALGIRHLDVAAGDLDGLAQRMVIQGACCGQLLEVHRVLAVDRQHHIDVRADEHRGDVRLLGSGARLLSHLVVAFRLRGLAVETLLHLGFHAVDLGRSVLLPALAMPSVEVGVVAASG